jgi:hypothetical protein
MDILVTGAIRRPETLPQNRFPLCRNLFYERDRRGAGVA